MKNPKFAQLLWGLGCATVVFSLFLGTLSSSMKNDLSTLQEGQLIQCRGDPETHPGYQYIFGERYQVKTKVPDVPIIDCSSIPAIRTLVNWCRNVQLILIEDFFHTYTDLDINAALIAAGADLNSQNNEFRDTLLHRSTRSNRFEWAKMLIDAGADLNLQNKWSMTPLIYATYWNRIDTAKALIDAGADVNVQDKYGRTPLNYATSETYDGHCSIAQILIDAGADPSRRAPNSDCEKMLKIFLTSPKPTPTPKPFTNNHLSTLQEGQLIRCHGDPETHPGYQYIFGERYQVKTKVPDVPIIDCSSIPAIGTLVNWCRNGDVLSIENFFQEYPDLDINAVSDDGRTAILYAADCDEYSCKNIVQYFINAGADVHVQNEWGRTPLYIAMFANRIEMVEMIIDAEADVNVQDKWGFTPLFYATWWNHITIAEMLIAAGADVNAQNNWGETPLFKAALKNRIKIVEMLIDAGADVNAAQDKWGDTLLHIATRFNRIDIAKMLIDAGAVLNAQNNWGGTPLLYATKYGHCSMAQILIDAGADPSRRAPNSHCEKMFSKNPRNPRTKNTREAKVP